MRFDWILGVATLVCLATPWSVEHTPRTGMALGAEDVAFPNGVDINGIIDGVIARSAAIYSTKLEYDYVSEIRKNDTSIADERRRLIMTIEGHDWMVRYADSPNFRMNRNHASVTYYEVNSKERGTDRALHMEDNVELLQLIGQHASHAAPRLGTFWFEQQAEFIAANRDKAVRKPDALLGHLRASVVEWDVTAQTLADALVVIPMEIAEAGRGVLRIYACEEVGWAIPRIEYVAPTGRVVRRFTAEQFDEVDDGIFFPMHATSEYLADDGRHTTSEFDVHQVEYTNQSLPEDEFELRIPPGTRVRDSRPGLAHATFQLQDPEQVQSLNWAIGEGSAKVSKLSTRMILLLVNIIFVALVTLYWIGKQCRMSH